MVILKKLLDKIGIRVLKVHMKHVGKFITFHNRPIYAKNNEMTPDTRDEVMDVAIVMQGRMVSEYGFTLETVRLYRKNFPKIKIIISTWNDKELQSIQKLKDENIFIILNKELENKGISNVNYQILSTTEGIKKAKELGAKYVLKTRTDQRIYNSQSFKYFDALLQTFPLKNENIQKERLIAISLNTFKYRPYSISDMTMYGTIDDMQLYWCIPHSEGGSVLPAGHSIIDWVKARQAEIYFTARFIESLGGVPSFSIAHSWRFYKEHFCIIDREAIDLYWHKYETYKEYRKLRYDGVYNDAEMNFNEWLMLYTNQNESAPEYIVNQKFGAKM
jgi:hypothetical protein